MRAQTSKEDRLWRDTSSEKKEGSLMSFGGLSDGRSGALPYGKAAMTPGELSPQEFISQRLPKPSFVSPGLSLGLSDTSRMAAVGGGSDVDSARRNKEDENDSRSESDNLEAISGDDTDQVNPRKKKRYHRHTPLQIQELEALFKECPHPDEKQRLELSKRLNLETRQVKFWFQNRRTQMKTQIERHENSILRQENDKLRAENMAIREAARNPVCNSCGGPAMLADISMEEQQLRIENARLKEELDRVCALAGRFLGKSISSLSEPISPAMRSSVLELGVGNNGFLGFGSVAPTISAVPDFLPGIDSPLGKNMDALLGSERSMHLELALVAMEELVNMAQMEEPLWVPSSDGGTETLNHEQYLRTFRRISGTGMPPVGYASEASRQKGVVIINSLALVETLMDAHRWADMFPCIIAKATTTEVISGGVGGTRDGALQLMHAELQVLSPLVAVREVYFLRFCKQHAEGVWAVVDVSVDSIRASLSSASCRRLPSGCVVRDMPSGYSKVTWVEHAEYEEGQVHQLYRPLLRSGLAFGAGRWVATLQRQCEGLAILMSSAITARDETDDHVERAEEHAEAGAADDQRLLRRRVRVVRAGVEQAGDGEHGGGGAGDDEDERERAGGAGGRGAERGDVGVDPRVPQAALRLPSRGQLPQQVGHPLQRRADVRDGAHRQRPGRRQRRLPPPRQRRELQPNQHADTAGDQHRRVRLHGGVRAGGHPSHAPRHERRRLRLRRPPPLRLCHPPRRCRRAAPDQRQPRLAADRGVPDPGEQPADGEADDGVGGDRQRPHLLHRPEDQGCTPPRRLNPFPPNPRVQPVKRRRNKQRPSQERTARACGTSFAM
ncbi:Homeobox-leucine zipper protein [Musa troglodytarum]|uniref:Homeobox-leucine zipper protein n=1 Tax=Musa troglodytarum TaxID=320322 RepID=A0A9E7EGD4_9LILI|nr:Homeobox-leucine zipper protein [Musa troglodytarum]URD76386.1 Homeobox-leucine zipper protein [Musa troglodytarum]